MLQEKIFHAPDFLVQEHSSFTFGAGPVNSAAWWTRDPGKQD